MSNYKNFITDFPKRCQRILDVHWQSATRNDVEVTLLMSIAGALLCGTRDRLGVDERKREHVFHNPLSDDARAELKQPISQAIPAAKGLRWCEFDCARDSITEQPESWEKFGDTNLEEPLVLEVLNVIRHALAHGQVQTRGKGRIESLALLNHRNTKKTKEWAWLEIEPLQLKTVIEWWTEFIAKHYKSDPRDGVAVLDELATAA